MCCASTAGFEFQFTASVHSPSLIEPHIENILLNEVEVHLSFLRHSMELFRLFDRNIHSDIFFYIPMSEKYFLAFDGHCFRLCVLLFGHICNIARQNHCCQRRFLSS